MRRLLLFAGFALLEMVLIAWAAGQIGGLNTLAIVVATGVLGVVLVKRQGWSVWQSARDRMATGTLPSDEMADGAMLLLGGTLLVTPGFLSDIGGFVLLVPAAREWLRDRFGDRVTRRFQTPPATRVEVWRV